MFAHNFKYSLKVLVQNKILLFWTFAFPIILGTFFHLAFSNIENSEKLDTISIAIVEKEEFGQLEYIKSALQKLDQSNQEDGILHIQYQEEEQAKKLLEKDEIVGYLTLEENPKITVKKSGIDETILKHIMDELLGTIKLINHVTERQIAESSSENQIQEIVETVQKNLSEMTIQIKDISNGNLSYTMIEYYTLIAMACLYGGILGMFAMNQNLANMSSKGKRISISNVKKHTLIISSLTSAYFTQIIGITILFLYTICILKVDFGPSIAYIILLALVGCFAGLSIGIATSTLIKGSENTKTGVILAITMFGCFLSGMMGMTMKYVIDKNIPLLNKINPASMITDGFYSLYYYETKTRFFFDLSSLILFSILLIALSMMILRRQKYDSI